mmetsp:Transcript_10220/g.10291  ORF Transcript_10220/g.10291 Transcript_10220/m.10291 type:complete len:300 (-) Transcript_10220:439-1338(-)
MISVWSEGEGYGCTFTLDLPLLAVDPDHVDDDQSKSQEKEEEEEKESVTPGANDVIVIGNQNEAEAVSSVSGRVSVSVDGVSIASQSVKSRSIEQATPPLPLPLPLSKLCIDTTEKSYKEKEKKIKILVADDSRMNRRMVIRLIQHRCEICVEAEDGIAAVEAYQASVQTPFDVILMDHRMPRMDGPQAVQRIRSLGHKGLIIGVTGNALKEDMEVLLKAGADLVMAKPLDMDEFDRVITDRINRKRKSPRFSLMSQISISASPKKRSSADLLHAKPLQHRKSSRGGAAVAVEEREEKE